MTALNRRLAGLFAWCSALAAATALAQTATPAKEEVVELSPFEVKSSDDRGYIAAETMTGTRVATQIKDLPYTVNKAALIENRGQEFRGLRKMRRRSPQRRVMPRHQRGGVGRKTHRPIRQPLRTCAQRPRLCWASQPWPMAQ